jgi:AcrR family transcriptional regulator
MTEPHSLKELIIEVAGELFKEQGYTATTIKQIAKAAGCTTAALYYYFEDGKQHILREVIRRSGQQAPMRLPQAESLDEFLVKLGGNLALRPPEVADRINWIILQFGTLPEEEKRIVQHQVLGIQHALREKIGGFVTGSETAERLAWLIFCSFLGYQQMFTKLEVGDMVDLSMEKFGGFMAEVITGGQADPHTAPIPSPQAAIIDSEHVVDGGSMP